jgi:hypothetical protein
LKKNTKIPEGDKSINSFIKLKGNLKNLKISSEEKTTFRKTKHVRTKIAIENQI